MTNDVSQIKNLIEKSLSKKNRKRMKKIFLTGKKLIPTKKMRNENPSEIGEWSENISWKEKKMQLLLLSF